MAASGVVLYPKPAGVWHATRTDEHAAEAAAREAQNARTNVDVVTFYCARRPQPKTSNADAAGIVPTVHAKRAWIGGSAKHPAAAGPAGAAHCLANHDAPVLVVPVPARGFGLGGAR